MNQTRSTASIAQRLLQRQRSSRMNPSTWTLGNRTCLTRNLTMRPSGKARSSPLFQGLEEPANLRQAYHSHEQSLLPAQSFSHAQVRRDLYTNQVQLCLKKNQVEIRNASESGFSLKEKILAEDTYEKQKYELLAESDERTIHELTRNIDSQRMESDHTFTGCEQSRGAQLPRQEELSEQYRHLRENSCSS